MLGLFRHWCGSNLEALEVILTPESKYSDEGLKIPQAATKAIEAFSLQLLHQIQPKKASFMYRYLNMPVF